MRRFISRSLVLATAALFAWGSGDVLAQPTPGPGPWSMANPLWFDLNADGIPQGGELTGHPTYDGEGCTQVVNYPSGLGPTQSPCAEVYEDDGVGGSIMRPNGTVQGLYTNADGTEFYFYEESYQQPLASGRSVKAARAGVRALAPASGVGRLLDLNGDGVFDSLEVEGQRPSGPVPQTRMSLVARDVTGDGRPDYISVPWTTSGAGMLGVFTGATPQILIPLTDTDADGWPDTITVQVANGGLSTTTGPPLSGPGRFAAQVIPSASSLGLIAFAAAVLAVGVKLLRGTLAVS